MRRRHSHGPYKIKKEPRASVKKLALLRSWSSVRLVVIESDQVPATNSERKAKKRSTLMTEGPPKPLRLGSPK